MSYEVKTELLKESIELARTVARAAQEGTIEVSGRRDMLGAARAMQGAVGMDIKARLADPRLRRQEAKLIEAENQGQLPAQ